MPTAGKVLTILIIPVAIAWLVLAAMATQFHRNSGEKIQNLEKQVEALAGNYETPGEIGKLQAQVKSLKYQITATQNDTHRQTTLLREQLSGVESLASLVKEDLARAQLLVRDSLEQEELARKIAERRTQEKADAEKAVADNQAVLEEIRQVDAQLREKRDALYRDFKAVLAENKQLVARLLQASSNN
ncbi:MAG: hypothetical protein U0800_03430 [Isosphaeraceae bacterium]